MAGIYIHIPFCKHACSYCDFHFSTAFESYRSSLLEAVNKELVQRKGELSGQTIESIYFGGGTPSLLNSEELFTVINTIKQSYTYNDDMEITLETNPDDFTADSLDDWKRAGVNRLSIGIQSFRDEDLKWMNRAHNASEAIKAIELAKSAGFEKLTIDLMYGLPNMKLSDWKKQLEQFPE